MGGGVAEQHLSRTAASPDVDSTGPRSTPRIDGGASTPASPQMVRARSTWLVSAEDDAPASVTPGTFTTAGTFMISS